MNLNLGPLLVLIRYSSDIEQGCETWLDEGIKREMDIGGGNQLLVKRKVRKKYWTRIISTKLSKVFKNEFSKQFYKTITCKMQEKPSPMINTPHSPLNFNELRVYILYSHLITKC